MTNYEDQEDELLALTSIYDEEMITVSCDLDVRQGSVCVEVEIPHLFSVALENREGAEHVVSHLPFIVLDFTLLSDYPSVSPPKCTLTCPWLTKFQLSLLTTELEKLWVNNCGSVILFTWIGFLQTETIAFLNIKSPLLLSEHKLPIVLDYDRTKCDRVFAGTMFSCQVCLCEKPGSACLQFWGCDHVFCKACLRDYFEVHIKDGSIILLKCPEDECGIQAHPTQVKELVSSELFERYDRLLLQLSLDTMNDIVYCPRKDCASPVVVDKDSAMGSCAACHHVFCVYCRMVWHGISVCKMKTNTLRRIHEMYLNGSEHEREQLEKKFDLGRLRKLIEEIGITNEDAWKIHQTFQNGSEGEQKELESKYGQKQLKKLLKEFGITTGKEAAVSICEAYMNGSNEEKLELEKKYGRKEVKKLVDEHHSQQWVDRNSKRCPQCFAPVEKMSGCNKMICYKCHSYFCWLCREILSRIDPYNHFRDIFSPCYQKLHQEATINVEEGNDDDDDDEEEDGGGGGDNAIV